MDFPAALTAAKAGKTIGRPSLPDVVLVWLTSTHPAVKPQLVRLFSNGAVVAHQVSPDDMAAEDWAEVKGSL